MFGILGKKGGVAQALGIKALRGAESLGKKVSGGLDKALGVANTIESIPYIGSKVKMIPGYSQAKGIAETARDASKIAGSIAGGGAGVLESKTPSEAIAKAMGVAQMGRQQAMPVMKELSSGAKFIKGAIEK